MGGTSSGHVTTFKHSSAEVGGDFGYVLGCQAWVELRRCLSRLEPFLMPLLAQ